MSIGTMPKLLALPVLALLLAPLTGCDEASTSGEDTGLGDDDDVTGDDDDVTGDDDDVTGDDDDSTGAGIADDAAGTYKGLAAGTVNDRNYTLTVEVETPTSVTVSGPGISSFTVPLVDEGGVLQQGKWNEGSFRLDGDELELFHSPQSFTFDGTRQ
jgi:hypothetical protein